MRHGEEGSVASPHELELLPSNYHCWSIKGIGIANITKDVIIVGIATGVEDLLLEGEGMTCWLLGGGW